MTNFVRKRKTDCYIIDHSRRLMFSIESFSQERRYRRTFSKDKMTVRILRTSERQTWPSPSSTETKQATNAMIHQMELQANKRFVLLIWIVFEMNVFAKKVPNRIQSQMSKLIEIVLWFQSFHSNLIRWQQRLDRYLLLLLLPPSITRKDGSKSISSSSRLIKHENSKLTH